MSLRGFVPTNSGVGAVAAPLVGVWRHSAPFEMEYSVGIERALDPGVLGLDDGFDEGHRRAVTAS